MSAEDISDVTVTNKYITAAEIANQAMAHAVSLCVPGAFPGQVGDAADKFIADATSKIFNNKANPVMKGTAVPTTVCVNEVVGGFAPFPEDDTVALKAGDLVKIDCGCQIDGYASTLAHSFVVGGAAEGRAGDVVVAAHQALEAAIRLLKPGGKTSEVTEVLAKVAADFKVNVVSGVLSHNVTKGVIDGKKVVLNRPDFDQKVDDSEFALYDVYHLDVVFSTGEGKPKEKDTRCTVFKKGDEVYHLKIKGAKVLFGEASRRFGKFPFSLRQIEDRNSARLGISECVNHGLLNPFPVLVEKAGELVAQFKATLLITPGGIQRITGFAPPMATSAYKIEDQNILALIATPLKEKKVKEKKNKDKDAMETD